MPLVPYPVHVLHTRANLLCDQERFALAEQSAREALVLAPHDSFGHALLARCLLGQGKLVDALREAREAVGLAPDDEYVYFALGQVQWRRGELREARSAAERALELAPDDADNWALLAGVLGDQSDWQASLQAAERGLAIDPEHRGCAGYRATALMRIGRSDEALAVAADGLVRDPENDIAHCNLGWALLHQGRAGEAIPHFQEALRLDPHYEFARTGLVEALKAQNRTYGALLHLVLWASRWPAWYQWAFVIVYLVAMRSLVAATRGMPYAQVAVRMLSVALLVFWLFSVLAGPLFALTLRFSRYGRHVLTAAQRGASNWHAACIAAVVLAFATWPWIGYVTATLTAIVFTYLVPPVTESYESPPGPARRWMTVYTVLLCAVGLAALAPLFAIALGPPAVVRGVVAVAVGAMVDAGLPPRLVITFPLWGVLLVLIGSYFSDNIARALARRFADRG